MPQMIPEPDLYPRAELPDVRKLILPDPDCFFVEADLAGADARVAAWECGGAYRDHFVAGVKIHQETMRRWYPSFDPKQEPHYTRCKNIFFGTIYGGKPPTIAAESGAPLPIVKAAQPWIFQKYPSIREWHRRIEHQLQVERTVRNAFGYRWIIFDRIDSYLPKALAWIPQSTVAIACFRGILHARKLLRKPYKLRFKLQNHDAATFQFPLATWPDSVLALREALHAPQLAVPYPEPLEMQWELKASARSWGHCKPIEWDNLQLDQAA